MPRKNTKVHEGEEELGGGEVVEGAGVEVNEETGEKVQDPDPVVPRENAVDPNSPAYIG